MSYTGTARYVVIIMKHVTTEKAAMGENIVALAETRPGRPGISSIVGDLNQLI